MFNISKGRLSLNVFCSPQDVLIKRAPDDESHPNIVRAIIKSEKELAKVYLHQVKQDYPELTLMCYFDCKGYTITKLSPKLSEDALGQMSVSFW
ncbi:MAG TPA: hypothetical protein VD794_03005 [Flavisolibacter sp.]|nr:hypothetical protein [Flavisolibacter sp.]